MNDDAQGLMAALDEGIIPARPALTELTEFAAELQAALQPQHLEAGLRQHLWQRTLRMTATPKKEAASPLDWPRRHPRSTAALVGSAVLMGAALALAQRHHRSPALQPR